MSYKEKYPNAILRPPITSPEWESVAPGGCHVSLFTENNWQRFLAMVILQIKYLQYPYPVFWDG